MADSYGTSGVSKSQWSSESRSSNGVASSYYSKQMGSGGHSSPNGMSYPRKRSAAFVEKAIQIRNQIADTKDEVLELRQDASDLQEYSNAKLTRVSRYLAVLGEKARKLDQAASEVEARILPLKKERKKLFNELLSVKGNIRVFCRVRPQFEGEGLSATAFPDDCSIRIDQGCGGPALPAAAKKDFELDQVYGPHVGQAHLFQDIQPFVQAVLDGYNACVIAYGQTGTGKTHTMEGPSHDRGVYFRAFDELFDLSNITSSMQPTSQCTFHVSALEIYNEQIRDLMRKQCDTGSSPRMHHEIQETEGGGVHVAGLHEEPVETPAEFNRAMRIAAQHKNSRKLRSHIMIIVHVKQTDLVTGEKLRSKLYMVDLAGSERLSGRSDTSGDRLTESLHINKSLSALGDCMSALTSKKGTPPYYNSKLTHILSDTMGGEAKTLLVVHCSPNARDAPESIASLNFAARARNVEISLGSKDTIKKWRDMANDARKEVYEKDKQLEEQHAEVAKLRQHLADAADERAEVARLRGAVASYEAEAEDQRAEVDLLHEALAESRRQVEAMQRTCSDAQQRAGLLSAELQEAHTFSASLEDDVHAYSDRIHRLQVEAAEQAERQRKVRQEHEALLASQRGQLEDAFRTRQEKLLAERHATVAALEVRLRQLAAQVEEATTAAEAAAAEAAVAKAQAAPKHSAEREELLREAGDAKEMNRRLEGELAKREELIERLHKENETLFNRISAPPREHVPQSPITRSISQPSINSPPTGNGSPRRDLPPQANGAQTGGSYRGLAPSLPLVIPESPTPDAGGQLSQASTPGSTRSRGGSVIVRTDSTPAGEYLTSGLADFNPDSFSSKVVAGDAANKLLMLVMAAASKAGPDRETEILQELQDPVVEFIRTTGTKVPLDPMLVTRVRLLYLRQLLRGKPKELQDVQVHPVEAFLEPASASGAAAPSHAARPSLQQQQQGGGRESDGGGEEPVARSLRMNLQAFRPEKKPARGVFGSKVMPNSPKHSDNPKVKELMQDAIKSAIGNCQLAAVYAHGDHEDIKRRIRRKLAETFDFLSLAHVAPSSAAAGGSGGAGEGDLALATSAIFDGWLVGLGTSRGADPDALGQLLSSYCLRIHVTQLKHYKDVSETLAVEQVDDAAQISRVLSALESVHHKKRKVLQEMQYDTLILSNTEATRQLYSSEEPRIASLKALEEILAVSQDILREAPVHGSAALKRVAQLQKLQVGAAARLTPVDSAVGEAAISRAQKHLMASGSSSSQAKLSRRASTTGTADTGGMSREVFPPGGAPGVPEQLNGETIYWTLVQFNNKQGTAPVVVKCGATSKLDLVVKMVKQKDAKGVAAGLSQLPDSVSLMCVPAVLNDMSMNEINAELQDLPEALRVLALSKTASGTRARYARLYKTLAGRVPSMRSGLGMELDDMGTPGAFSRENSIPSTPQKSPSREPGALPRGTSLPVRNEELF